MTIQDGENEVAHLLALKEISAKTHPGMHEEEVALKDKDDAYAEAESLIAELEETQI